MDNIAERLARAALEGFFESPSFSKMDSRSCKKAVANVQRELNKLNLVPVTAETPVSE